MTREYRFHEARQVLEANGYTCSGLLGIRFTATDESGHTLRVELRPQVHIKQDNMYIGLYMCFPVRGNHYLLPHDTLVEIVGETANWLNTRSWIVHGQYTSRNPNQWMLQRLEEFRLHSPDSSEQIDLGAQSDWESIRTNWEPVENSMLGSRWTREQDLAVFYIRHRELTQYVPALADAMKRTAGAIWGRMASYDYLDPFARHFGQGKTTRLTRSIWTEYQRNPLGLLSEAEESFHSLVGPIDSHIEAHNPSRLGTNSISRLNTYDRYGLDVEPRQRSAEEMLAAIFGHDDVQGADTSTIESRSSETEELSSTAPYRRAEYSVTPLHEAARAGHIDIVRALVAAGADLRALDESGHTPLHVAARMGHTAILKLLIDAGSNINPRTGRSRTPLHSAIVEGDADRARELISLGADVNAQDEDGATPLHCAVQAKQPALMQTLIAAGANVNAQTDNGNTPLIEAIASDSAEIEMIQALISAGADVNARNSHGITLLVETIRHGLSDIVQLLIPAGADVNGRDVDGMTPLHEAVSSNQPEIVQALICAGADVNAKDDAARWTPLHLATSEAHTTKIAQMLISAGADFNARDQNGATPLHKSVGSNQPEIVQVLICAGADVNVKDDVARWAPLHLATSEAHTTKIAQMLISAGADFNARDQNGATPLHHAAEFNRTELALFLVSAGAHVDAGDESGNTPLHLAAQKGNTETAQALIFATGAIVDLPNERGLTPLHMASIKGHADTAETLLAAGADLLARDIDGLTPFYSAYDNGHEDVLRILRDAARP